MYNYVTMVTICEEFDETNAIQYHYTIHVFCSKKIKNSIEIVAVTFKHVSSAISYES